MTTERLDVAILGAGSAGLSALRAARLHTPKARLIDPGPWGTTCARVGCMPSKLLIAAAEAAHAARHAAPFGIDVAGVSIDGARVMQRVRSERDRFVGFVLEDMHALEPEHLWRGRARFVDAHTLDIESDAGTRRVRADRIVIATGSRPDIPPGWREALGDRLIVNDDVFDWAELPRSVAVAGAGVIGLELALALHRLGVRVRLFARAAQVGPLTDPALAASSAQIFAAALPIEGEAEMLSLGRSDDGGVELTWRTPAATRTERFDRLLCATGRRPNIDGFGLEALAAPLGIAFGKRGVPEHDPATGRIGETHLFIAGDVANERPLLHEAADEGHIAGDNAGRFPQVLPHPRRTPLAVVFSEPQLMIAGQSHRALLAARTRFVLGRVSFENQGRSRVMLRNQGALHVYACLATRRVLGAEMIGPAAEHLGHLLAWSIGQGITVDGALSQPFYHPVIEEGLRTALRDAKRALDKQEICAECTPGD
ncbi:MAG TPA: dihydrolipoyl dehydrogenase [Methylibium sp.]|uniref:dihydrolipoyl dehydrogenase n=1 Tax=Methylibium sp. TaxID=2067992 RepID=UPI002DBE5A99|nr:dihydrolipoyl dehydrogenase [Methylibium sp.]HEU4459434.1 dihydrolipoyl dehydrogenase [Methylibium sp.]